MNKNSSSLGRRLLILAAALVLAAAAGMGLAWAQHRKPAPPAQMETQPPAQTQPPAETMATIVQPTQPPAPPWNLILVNPWNEIPEDYSVELYTLDSGHQVDQRCATDLEEMLEACREAGLRPVVCSSYRTQQTQQNLYENKVQRVMNEGYGYDDALVEAAKVVAVPGTSEHQLGLALDIVDKRYQVLDEAQENTDVQIWLMEHSWEYGFILRYPNDKTAVTGIIYEPWHYRYVGREAAREIYESGLCLEEYLEEKY